MKKIFTIGTTALLAPILAGAAGVTTANWTTNPAPRQFHSMAYDAARSQTVLFGGVIGTNSYLTPFVGLGETWVRDGLNWTRRTPAHRPNSPSNHAMAYDTVHQQTILFGGAETWAWDGSDWTQKTPAHSPPARTGNAMAYDAARQQTVLFAGQLFTGPAVDTWVWDGVDWTQKNPVHSPLQRKQPGMVYDASHGQVVLFGGLSYVNGQPNGETWTWDGTDWAWKFPTASPSARYGHAMAYDSSRHKIAIFGGWDGTNDLWDTAEWDGGPVVTSTGFLYSRVSQKYNGTVSLTYVGNSVLVASLSVVFKNLPPGVSLVSPTGTLNGDGYIAASVYLQPGQSYSFPVQFTGPFPTQITFATEVYYGSFQ